jgi:hypothetical protein
MTFIKRWVLKRNHWQWKVLRMSNTEGLRCLEDGCWGQQAPGTTLVEDEKMAFGEDMVVEVKRWLYVCSSKGTVTGTGFRVSIGIPIPMQN